MKQLLAFIFAVILAFSTLAYNIQLGYVKTRGRLSRTGVLTPGKRLANATIILQQGSSVISNEAGNFSLKLPSERYYLKDVKKKGFILSDPDILSKQYVCSSNPLVLVLDDPTAILDDKLANERIQRRMLQMQLQQKEDEIESLKKQNKITEDQYREQLQKLYSDAESNEKFISEMSERYSKLDFDQLDDFQRQMAALIQNGELAKADSLLRTKGSMDDREAEINRIRKTNANEREEIAKRQKDLKKGEKTEETLIADFVADCYNRFELCKLKFDNDSAVFWLERRIQMDSLNMDWRIELADFYYEYIADYDKAYDGFNNVIQNKNADISHILEAKYGKMKVFLMESKYDEALQEALSCQNIEDANNIQCRESEFYIGCAYSNLGQYDKAEEYYDKHIHILYSRPDTDSVSISNAYNSIGCNYMNKGEYEKAYSYIRKSMEIREELFIKPNLEIATSYLNLSIILDKMTKYDEALDYAQRALEMRVQILGRDHPSIATALNNLGVIYIEMTDYDRAIQLIKEAIEIDIKYFGENNINIATDYNNLGVLYTKKKDYEEALKAYEKSLAIRYIYFDNHHPSLALILNNLGSVHTKLNNFDEAISYYNEAMDIYKTHFGNNSDNVALCDFNIGSLYMRQGKYEDAITMIESARTIYESIFGNNHKSVADCNFQLGKIYRQLKDYVNARNKFYNAYIILLNIHGEVHPHTIKAKEAVEKMDEIIQNK